MSIKGKVQLSEDNGFIIFSTTGEIFHQCLGNIKNIAISMGEAKYLMDNLGYTKASKQYFIDDQVKAFAKVKQIIDGYVATPVDLQELHSEEPIIEAAPQPETEYWN